jgi:hypothetical protein
LDEQRGIVDDLVRRLSLTAAIRSEIAQVSSKATTLRIAILGAAFTGRLWPAAGVRQARHMPIAMAGAVE